MCPNPETPARIADTASTWQDIAFKSPAHRRGAARGARGIDCHPNMRSVRALTFALATALVLALWLALPTATTPALADDDAPDYSTFTLDELKEATDAKARERDEAQAKVDELAARIADGRAQLDQIDARLPEAQRQAERSVRERYKVQRQYGSLVEVLLYAEDWQSFTAGLEYIAIASRAHIDQFVDLRQQRADRDQALAELDAQKAQLDTDLDRLTHELDEVTQARDEKQRKADLVAATQLVPDGSDWSAGEKAFVDKWKPRLDAYLAGSPLAGQGEIFAKAAWKVHIDPRYSAAISNIESGKGQACIRPHNAWGWGAAEPDPYGLASEWATWEDAINAHAEGLARGYGYDPTPENAQKYCPPNWEDWYVAVVTAMNSM